MFQKKEKLCYAICFTISSPVAITPFTNTLEQHNILENGHMNNGLKMYGINDHFVRTL